MDFTCEERRTDSPYVFRVWQSDSYDEIGTPFTSIASNRWEMVISKYQDSTTVTVRGPETRPTPAFGPPDAEFIGIQFTPGTFMPQIPPGMVLDRCDATLPPAGINKFWLNGSAWQFPTAENVDTFIEWMVRDGLLVIDPVVEAVLNGEPVPMSLRTVQRRFLQATGLTYGMYSQIERARFAVNLLKDGMLILDVVDKLGYADQPHLTRSIKRWMGYTPTQITDENRTEPMSFLFNTEPF